ncbi:uncharacterized protein LOC132713971 [Ruditapes philippinarum]|uniref:uncharacterized protein LOC132713971 n=1 Tax=Ruditapes philippinarum TaxID=129788 RepID=UPI00295AE0E7|nr:uncharacterized protein LOC132713971 [Ruditapes philippinarum]
MSPEVVTPVGRLRGNLKHWKEACSNEYIIDVIDKGYKLPFMNFPATTEIKNNSSALENSTFVTAEIQNLVAKGCVSEVQSVPLVVNPLTVAFNRSGKARLVLDCRHVNPVLFKSQSRYEDQSVARQLFHKGDYVFSFDIKSAYHHIMIDRSHRTYLGFHWTQNGHKKYYVFNVLPFGISTAGYIFTKVLRVLVEKWRSLGLRVVLFLDDGLGGNHTFAEALRDSSFIRQDLIDFGFLIADEKCNWQPCLFLTWLGYFWDMEQGILRVTEDRLERAFQLIEQLVLKVSTGQVFIPVRMLACLTGQLLSMQCVLGPVVRLKSRSLYQCIQSKASWNAPVKVSSEVLSELIFWKENLRSLNMCSFGQMESVDNASVSVDVIGVKNVFVDASGSGFGSYVDGIDDSQFFGNMVRI